MVSGDEAAPADGRRVPLMQTSIFGLAINYDGKHLETVVLDEVQTVRKDWAGAPRWRSFPCPG